jgi:hypothetical protein
MTRATARDAATDLVSMTDQIARKDPNWWLALFTIVMLPWPPWWIGSTLITALKENTQALSLCRCSGTCRENPNPMKGFSDVV